MYNTRRHFIQALGSLAVPATALGTLTPFAALAQALESVKIVVGFPAGGTSDATSRRVGERLGGTSFAKNAAIVDNKPGAAGRIACETVKAAAPDGSTLLLTPYSCMAIYPHTFTKLSYDPARDFSPISTAVTLVHGLAVGPMVPASVKTANDFLAWAQANPKDASFGSPGAGGTTHFIGVLMGMGRGIDLKHIPYRGSLPAITDVISGQIAASITPIGDTLANYKAGKLRLIATSGSERSPFAPEVGTLAEAGFPELTTEEWFAFYAPAKTPAATITAAHAAINAALKDKAVIDSLATFGLVTQGSTPAALAKSQHDEVTRWGPMVKKSGFTPES